MVCAFTGGPNIPLLIAIYLLVGTAAALLFDGEESLAFRSVMQLLLFPVVYILLLWQPPFSGLYGRLIIAAFAVAVRDQLQPFAATRSEPPLSHALPT